MSAKPKGLQDKAAILAYAKELGVSVELDKPGPSRVVIFGPDKKEANLSLWDEAKHPRDSKGRFGSGGSPPGSPGERPNHSVVMSSSDTLFFTPTSRKSYPQMSEGFNHDDPAYAYGSYRNPLESATKPPFNRPELALQGFADDPTPQLRSRVKELYPELEILRYNQRDYGLGTGKKLSGTGARFKGEKVSLTANPFTDLRLWSEAKHPRDTHGRFGHNNEATIRELRYPLSSPTKSKSESGSPRWQFTADSRTIQAQLVTHENTLYIGGGAAPAYRHALVKFFNRELPDVAKIVYEDTLGGRKTYVLWHQKPKTSAKLSANPFTDLSLWDEAKHPRDSKGRFGSGSASSTGTITPAHAAARKRTQDARDKKQEAARKQEQDARDVKTKTPLYMSVHYFPHSNLAPQAGVALQSIDKVHTDGVLPDLNVNPVNLGAENARYVIRDYRTESRIDVDPDKEAPALSLVHEIGHFIDQQALGDGLKFASTNQFTREAPVRNLMQTLHDSDAIRTLQDMRDNPQNHKVMVSHGRFGLPTEATLPPQFLDYMLEPREQFARAYSQYIAAKADNPVLDRQLYAQRDKWDGSQAGTPFSIPFQWQDKDFEPISGAFDALFASRGWLR